MPGRCSLLTRYGSVGAADIQRIIRAELARQRQTPDALALPSVSGDLSPAQDALYQHMVEQQAPAKVGTPIFSPGAPLAPQPGMMLPDGPLHGNMIG